MMLSSAISSSTQCSTFRGFRCCSVFSSALVLKGNMIWKMVLWYQSMLNCQTRSTYLFAVSLVRSPAFRDWGHSSGHRWPFRPLESRTKNDPASPGEHKTFTLLGFTSNSLKKSIFSNVVIKVKCYLMLAAGCKYTLNCYSGFPEHVRVLQQLWFVSVDSDDLTAPVENSAVAQSKVTHSACKYSESHYYFGHFLPVL